MQAVLANPLAFAEVRHKALMRARDFRWSRTAELTREVYAAALDAFR